MELTRNFRQLNKNNVDIAGGKAASLGEMTNAGIPVPSGFVILSTSFDYFLKESHLIEEIDAILDSVNHQEIHTIEAASEKIQNLIINAEILEDIKKEIETSFEILNARYVAVRSSATAEDGVDHAWAGQLNSYLNTTKDDLLEKVKYCWASLFTTRAIFYRFEKGLHKTHISVAVVVQKMVDSEISGIAFSVHPVTEDRNQLIVEAGFGLGEAIVSGEITPDSYVVEKNPRNIIDITTNTQVKALYRGEKGNTEWCDIPEPQASSQVLTIDQILELSELILKIENHYGFPCDIEWAFEKGKFYIVQSRPITTLQLSLSKNEYAYKLIFASDGFAVLNTFNLKNAGYIRHGGVLSAEYNNKVSLFIKATDLALYGKDGYELFSSKTKTQQLINDIEKLIEDFVRHDNLHVGNIASYSNNELAEHLKATSVLSVRFISLYGLIESHNTYYTEERINEYTNQNREGLKDIPIFDIIFTERENIKDIKIKELCDNVALLASFKLSTKEKMNSIFNSHSALIRESRKRFNLSSNEDIRLLSLAEIQSYLIHGFNREEYIQLVEKRKDWFVIKIEDGNESVLYGEEAKKEIELMKMLCGLEGKDDTDRKFTGQTASTGIYIGRAVVVPYIRSVDDEVYKNAFSVFKEGDILVTKNSVPEIIEIIKKASAIVTEEGGITCHGAIMAREFKVPGIVGVDGITDQIKTGDIIEVNALGVKGLIRKR